MQISAPVRRLDDGVDALPDGGAGRDHLERPYQPGLLTGFQLCDVVPGVRHAAADSTATARFPAFRGVRFRLLTAGVPAAGCRQSRRSGRPPEPAQACAGRGLAGANSTARARTCVASASRRSAWATWRSSPVSPISPKAASGCPPPPSATPLRGRRQRQRHRQVGARLLHPDAAGDRDEDVAQPSPRRRGAPAPRGPGPAGCGPRRWPPAAAAPARSAPPAPAPPRAAAASPPSRTAPPSPGRARGLRHEARARRPRPPRGPRSRISKTPTSLVEPKRFLSARSVR